MKEQWKDIPGYEGLYQASSAGRIKSYDMIVGAKGGVTAIRRGRVLKFTLSGPKRDYPALTLCRDKIKKTHKIHRLIALSFLGEPEGLTVDHIDGNKSNNELINLRYCTTRENCTHYTSSLNANRPYTGVSKQVRCINKWAAHISINGKRTYIGIFDTPELARDAYLAKRDSLNE